jgi:hypothetical protein
MMGLPLIAFIVYLFTLFGGAISIIYGYSRWKTYADKKEMSWILLGIFAIFCVGWALFTRHLVISGTGNASVLLSSRKVLGFFALFVGLTLIYRQYIRGRKNDNGIT